MKKHKVFITISLVLAAAVTLIAQQQNTASKLPQPHSNATAQSAIIAKLEEIVQIREKIFKSNELLIQAGRLAANTSGEIELIEARIDLARERGHKEQVIKESTKLVAAHEQQLKRLQSAGNEVNPVQIDQAKASLLQAEVRLLREQKKDASQ